MELVEKLKKNVILQHRELLLALAKRDIIARYKGSILGMLWNFINPLLMLTIYSFVFGLVFKAKWGMDVNKNFAVILYCGLIIHSFLAEVINSCPNLMQYNANYVKKIVFPLEILPLKIVLTSIFNLTVNFLILLVFIILGSFEVSVYWLYFPLVIFPLLVLSTGIAFLISAIGAYIKDTAYIVGFITTVLLFLSPIFYPMSAIPENYHIYIYINPLAYIIEQARIVMIYEDVPDVIGIVIYTMASFFILIISINVFKKLKSGFSDVI
ncbi:ABC transporter permease [Vibrio cholerae]|uniref:ABC transporter permease n=1 Tax=Vibrio cholerae TaxID=666 RepID=UPI000C9A3221|nr:ABC transporter permease [Vibrio cholerae]EGR2082394.1 ABC transporter permease [Vibrio cholerae]ELF6477671.1 ABC transporter permease [Vibrio cholerae]QEO42480.1 ABC transporter permease [Vibrio cholerae]